MLAAQQHSDTLTTTLLAAQGRPAEMAALQQYLDDIHAIARAAISALHGPVPPPMLAAAVLDELGAQPGAPGQPGQDAGTSTTASPEHGQRRQLAPFTAFASPSPTSCSTAGAATPTGDRRLACQHRASRRQTSGPANMLTQWDLASIALQAALARPLASRLDTFYQLRYRALAGPARIPDPAWAEDQAAALPSLLWPGWGSA